MILISYIDFTEQPFTQLPANLNPSACAGFLGGKDKLVGGLGKADADSGLGVAVDIIEHSLQGGVLVVFANGNAVNGELVLLKALAVLVQTETLLVYGIAFGIHTGGHLAVLVLYLSHITNGSGQLAAGQAIQARTVARPPQQIAQGFASVHIGGHTILTQAEHLADRGGDAESVSIADAEGEGALSGASSIHIDRYLALTEGLVQTFLEVLLDLLMEIAL